METKCSNCSGPVYIPLDRGVANCKNCGKLEGRYCTDCNIAMPKGTAFCPGCGLSFADTQKRMIKKAFKSSGPNSVATIIVLLVLTVPFLLINNVFKGCERDSKAAAAQSKQRDAEDTRFVETEIRPRIEQAGAKLIYTNPRILRIQLPGPVSEYEAERLARSVLDRLPNGTAVKVLDDVGILRAHVDNNPFSRR
jgi:hypothetical protein